MRTSWTRSPGGASLLLALVLVLALPTPAPADDDAGILRLDALLARGDAHAALARARALLASPDLEPRNAWRVRQRIGAALLALGRGAEAVDALETALEDASDEPSLHVNLARAWRQAGQPGRAVAGYRQALRLSPERALWRLEYADLLQSLGASRDADREIAAAREACGDCREALLAEANLKLATGDHGGAIAPLRSLLARGPDRRVRELLVESLWNAGEAAGVVALLDTVPGRDLAGDEIMALVQAERRLGRYDRSLAWARGDAGDLPADWQPPATFWAIAAEACLAGGEAEAALAAIDRALELRPDTAIYHHNRAAALVALGRDREARRALETARRLDPELGDAP